MQSEPRNPLATRPVDDDERRFIDGELARLLCAAPGVVFPATLLCVLAAAAALWSPERSLPVALWLTAVLGTLAVRVRLCRSCRRRDSPPDRRWLRAFGVSLLATGLLWAVAVLSLFPQDSDHRQLLLAFVIAGLSAAAATLHAPFWWAFAAYGGPALGALGGRFLVAGNTPDLLMGLLTFAFLVGLALLSARFRTTLTESLLLRHRVQRLAEDAERANRALLERTREQERVHAELRQRDAVMQAVRFAATRLLDFQGWESDPAQILQRLGEAARVSRVRIVHHVTTGDESQLERTWEWTRERAETDAPPLFAAGHEPWRARLRRGEWVAGSRDQLGEQERELLDRHGVRSVALFPILVDQLWWGVLSFEDLSTARSWSRAEAEALASAAGMLAAALQGLRAEEAVSSSDDRFRLLAENTSDLVCLHDPGGRLLYVSPSSEPLLGYLPHQLLDTDPLELVQKEDRGWARRQMRDRALQGEVTLTTLRLRRRDGEYRWFETTSRPVLDDDGQVELLVTSSRDVTTRKDAEEQLFREKELAQVTLKSIGDGVVTTDAEGRVQYLNPVACRLLGLSESEVRGRPLGEALGEAHPGSQRIAQIARRAWASGRVETAGEALVVESTDEEDLALEVSCAPILSRDGQALGTVTVLHDVTRTRTLAQQLSYQASHDSLTGLINRWEFEQRLKLSLRRRRRGEDDALCYLDLDQFKVVNDTCGHVAGDELLRQLAGVLRTHTRRSDVVGRLGGDEFGILLTRCPPERAEAVANSLCEAIRGFRFTWDDKVFQLGASIGVVPITPDTDVHELLSAADAACYAAKDQGRNRVHLFKPDDRTLAHRRGEMEWVAQLHRALEQDRFELCYQPILDAVHDRIVPHRLEILLTMISETGERIPPGSFIPAAERFNTMPSIDRWVVARTIATFADHWRRDEPVVRECFINISGTSLTDPTFGSFVKQRIQEHGVPSGILCFEITETAAITNLTEARRLIEELRELGCRFALDDFGSGLSSFAYLRGLPVDFLKIDGIFVKDIDRDSVNHSIVESIQRVGRMLGLKTIAESVENDAVLARLVELGVDLVQGYGLARPAPLARLFEQLAVEESQRSAKRRTLEAAPRQQSAAR